MHNATIAAVILALVGLVLASAYFCAHYTGL